MFRNFFDHPLTLLVVILLVVVVFGAKRLPDVSRSLARSMRIFKSEVREMKEEDRKASPSSGATGSTATGASSSTAHGSPTYPLEGRVVDAGDDGRTSDTAHPVHETPAEPRRSA